MKAGFGRVAATLRELRRYRELFVLLVAFLGYNDGVGTIIKMAPIYGQEVGIDAGQMIGALIVVQAFLSRRSRRPSSASAGPT